MRRVENGKHLGLFDDFPVFRNGVSNADRGGVDVFTRQARGETFDKRRFDDSVVGCVGDVFDGSLLHGIRIDVERGEDEGTIAFRFVSNAADRLGQSRGYGQELGAFSERADIADDELHDEDVDEREVLQQDVSRFLHLNNIIGTHAARILGQIERVRRAIHNLDPDREGRRIPHSNGG